VSRQRNNADIFVAAYLDSYQVVGTRCDPQRAIAEIWPENGDLRGSPLAIPFDMPSRPVLLPIAVLLIGLALSPRPAAARSLPHLRPLCPEMQRALETGVARSRSFRAIVAALERSDVVVYLRVGRPGAEAPPGGGRTAFVAAAAGLRYLQISIVESHCRTMDVATLGHELRHALEIAAAPSIMDAASLGRYYDAVGYLVAHPGDTRAYESRAAVESGCRILDELLASATSVEWNELAALRRAR
jgi:hypothetical protein